MGEVAYQNKDITSKIFAESLLEKSFEVYGIHMPVIKEVWPTNLPRLLLNELRLDNLFLLADGTLALVDYESDYRLEDTVKYINYVNSVYKKYHQKYPTLKIRMIVLYTCDVEEQTVELTRDMGCLQLQIEAGYLSRINTEETYQILQHKIQNQQRLSDDELMKLIILPLTVKGQKPKQQLVRQTINLAKSMADDQQELTAIAGIITFADKIISKKYSNEMREWIRMTKVGKLFEEEKQEAIKETTRKVTREVTKEVTKEVQYSIAQKLKLAGTDLTLICETTGLTMQEVQKL